MQALSLDAAIPRAILTAAQEAHGPTPGQGTYNYYMFGYISSCQYCFEFTNDNCDGIIPRDNTLGHLVIRLKAIPWDGDLPIDSMNNWTMSAEWRRGEMSKA